MSSEVHPLLQDWFDAAVAALKKEDAFLRDCLQPFSSGAYARWDRGIGCLYETSIVYLILKELWTRKYPRALSWEYSYPDWSGAKAELVIFHETPQEKIGARAPWCAIEVKKKSVSNSSAEQNNVWWDFLKLLWFHNADHRYVLLLTYGPAGTLFSDDIGDLLNRRLGRGRAQLGIEDVIEAIIKDPKYRQYYRDHFGGIDEVLWTEFDTSIACYSSGGKVRVSLLEFHRRLDAALHPQLPPSGPCNQDLSSSEWNFTP